MDNFQNLVPVEYQSQRVLTSAQIAEYYKTTVVRIKQNFNANKDRFVAGKHFFKIDGNDLQNLRVAFGDLQISPKTRTLYLWTKRGAARHAKMLNTNKAWEVFEELEDCYFEQLEKSVQADDTRATLSEIRSMFFQILEAVNSSSNSEKILNELAKAFKQFAQTEQRNGDFERGKTLAKMIFALKASPKKERIADIATNLIVGEKVF